MAVTEVRHIRGDEFSEDANGPRVTARYLVYCADTDGPLVARTAVDPNDSTRAVPRYGDGYAGDTRLKADSISANRHVAENNPCFLVVVQFTSTTLSVDRKPTDGENVKWNRSVSCSGSEIVERVNSDRNGNRMENSAGDLYPAEVELVKYDSVISVTYDTDDPSNLQALEDSRGHVNSDAVTLTITRYDMTYTRTFPAGTLKLGNATWTIETGPDGGHFSVTIPLIHRHQLDSDGNEIGWTRQIPDRGYYYYNSDDSRVESPVQVDLDGSGGKLTAGGQVNLLPFDLEPEANFLTFLTGI